MRWFGARESLLQTVYSTTITYKTPLNLTSTWNWGILGLVCLVSQLATGVFLTMGYTADISLAFSSIERICRDINFGWLLRYVHANGASLFFTAIYLHILRGLYFGSYKYPRHYIWIIGSLIYILMIVTAFLGYVLPWGQMSFWGATVITNLFSAIPIIGQTIVEWLWGGFSVSNATLIRFYSLHFLLPFFLIALVGLHIILLHMVGSSNPLGIKITNISGTPFHPQYTFKDSVFCGLIFIFFINVICFGPDIGSHPDNYVPANSLVTPPHIVPEWYFLPYYAILRSIPDKLIGVCALALAIIFLLITPITGGNIIQVGNQADSFTFWLSFLFESILGWIGGQPIEPPFLIIGQVVTVLYFVTNFIRPYYAALLPSCFEPD